MTWLGFFIGLMLGAAFESFSAAMFLGALGAFVGHLIGRSGPANGSNTNVSALEIQVRNLQEQMGRMTHRITELEARLGKETVSKPAESPLTAAPVVSTDAPSDPEQAQTEFPSSASSLSADQPVAPLVSPAAPRAAAIKTAGIEATLSVPMPSQAEHAGPAQASAQTPAPVHAVLPAAEPVLVAEPPLASAAPPIPHIPPAPPKKPAEPSWLSVFIQRWVIGGNPLVKVGVLILFLGLAFLLRYVAEHTVVPIELRYAGVAAAGIGLLLFGWRLRNKPDNYGVILQGAGVGVLYLTTLAAMKLHTLVPLEFGFAVLFCVAAFAALLAILQNALPLAVAGTLGGFAAPVLASTGSEHHVAFFSYLTLVNLGIVAIAWFKAWRVLNLIGFVCSFTLAAAWGEKYYEPELFGICQPFLLLLFALYVLITFLFARRTLAEAPPSDAAGFENHVKHAAPHVSYVDGTLAFGVPLATFGMQYLITRHLEYGAAFSALGFGLAYVVFAFLLFRRSGMRYALLSETLIALAVVFGSLAIPLGLEQKWTSAAWAVEAAGVYWVGVRQQRVHARLFALLLLFGSAVYFALGLHVGTGSAVLDGSLLGSAMLAASLWLVYRMLKGAPADHLHGFEHAMRGWLLAFGALFIALLPFLLWAMDWAATALAILGTVAVYASRRMEERALTLWGCLYQALAGALFLTTLHGDSGGSGGAVLARGWHGLLAASLIGGAMLAGVWAMARQFAAGDGKGAPAKLGGMASVALLAGLAFVNLAPLFVLPWRFAALVWPVTGIATLWWALRMRHTGALVFALVLQGIAGAAWIGSLLLFAGGSQSSGELAAFMHSGFWGPLLIALAAFVCARLLHKNAQATDIFIGWVTLFWAAAWWAFAWVEEINRLLLSVNAHAAMIGMAIATFVAWSLIARWRDWPQLAQTTLAFVPALFVLLASAPQPAQVHPLLSWGAAAWPLALLAHLWLLRRLTEPAILPLVRLAHTVGAWLFVLVAALELRWQFAEATSADTAWPLLGWMIAPVAYLWAVISPALRRRWPLREFHVAYVVAAALPMVVYLLGWVWIGNAVSSGNAAPLPYVPLLNPLEIAQAAVLLGIAAWWWTQSETPAFGNHGSLLAGVVGASTLAVITGMVMRTCHHWGDVAWRADALLGSTMVQASLSIVWSMSAIGLMLFGNRQRMRWVWIAGASLIAVVVAKLFLVELAASGSLARIVSFIVVGLLLLLVGYFAPLPPRKEDPPAGKTPADPSPAAPENPASL